MTTEEALAAATVDDGSETVYCTVDDDTRLVTIPDKYKKLGVESDEKAKRIWFRFPKLVGNNGVDLSVIGVRVNFRNANGDGDIYIVEDLTTDEDYVTFSWELTRKVTAYKGNVSFVVCAVKSNTDGTTKNEWNTTLNKECEVLEGLEVTEQIEQENPDIIEYILANLGRSVSAEQIAQAVEEYMENNPPSGMTAEEKEQLQKNTEDISSLSKEKVENPLTGVVGQILEIETVDESGKPKTYKAVNKPSGGGEVTNEQISNAVDNYMKEHPFTETDPTVPDWAKQSQKPTYTASEVGALPIGTKIPSKTSDLQNDSGFLTEHQDLSDYALKSEVPKSASDVGADASGTAESKVSEHNISDTAHNDIRLLIQGLIERLNALANSDDETLDQMNEVVAYIKSNKSLIDAITTSKVSVSDIIDNLTTNVSNKPLSAAQGVALKALIDAIAVPTKLSELENDSGFLTEHQDLSGYATKDEIPKTASDVGADASGTAESKVSEHNTSDTAHNDIRLLLQGLTNRLNALADSDDETLDQMSEVVAYIKNNKNLIDDITTRKVNVSDIINNLTTNLSNKVLSASMGVELKKLIDAIKVPVNLSELAGDTTHRTVTDAEKTAWNNKSTFSGNYNDLTNKPSLFSGNYNDLSGKPTLITEERVNELINAKLPKSAEEVQY